MQGLCYGGHYVNSYSWAWCLEVVVGLGSVFCPGKKQGRIFFIMFDLSMCFWGGLSRLYASRLFDKVFHPLQMWYLWFFLSLCCHQWSKWQSFCNQKLQSLFARIEKNVLFWFFQICHQLCTLLGSGRYSWKFVEILSLCWLNREEERSNEVSQASRDDQDHAGVAEGEEVP